MHSELFYIKSLDRSISNRRGVPVKRCLIIFTIPPLIEIPVHHANSVDPDETPRSGASDLVLQCLQMLHL